jgi:hypothetical protein
MDTYGVLVVILAAVLAVFLVLSIVAAIFMIKILHRVNKITASAEGFAKDAEDILFSLKNSVGPIKLLKIIYEIFNKDRKASKARRDR